MQGFSDRFLNRLYSRDGALIYLPLSMPAYAPPRTNRRGMTISLLAQPPCFARPCPYAFGPARSFELAGFPSFRALLS